MRCIHERQMHKHSSYITLTYNDQHLPQNHALRHRDYQLFMKRLRKALGRRAGKRSATREKWGAILHGSYGASPHTPAKIAFYMAGEYGELTGRPHYHAILFGIDFADRVILKHTPSGARIYESQTLQRLWPHGFSSVGDVTFESAAYVARYVMKKRTGDGNTNNYEILDLDSGEIITRKKEYNCMSRRPGIGKAWLDKYSADVYTTGKVIVRGHKNNPPRYYDKLYKKLDAAALAAHQHARYLEQLAQIEHHTPERLAVQEQVAKAKTRNLKRNLD